MKKIWQMLPLLLIIPFFFHKDRIEQFDHVKPAIPAPVAAHPWIQTQPLSEIVPEMVRDIELFESCALDGRKDELIHTLLSLQADLPFSFPEHLYNVFCISDPPKRKPHLYRIYKRVYFGDTDLGMPMYLDVRVFDAQQEQVSDILDWHFHTIEGEFKPCGNGLFGEGAYAEEDLSHGFANERALFIMSSYEQGRLFVLYSDVPIAHKQQLKSIASQCSHTSQK